MKIIELVSENFKRLNARVVMDGKSVTVQGKNGVGKSSFIDAIWIALTGKDVPEQPIQQGKDSAKVEVTVKADDGSQFIVERKFLPSGGTLTVKTLDGAKFPSPQKFLDEKIGRISFDPFEFINKPPREQKKFLMDLLGIDLTALDIQKNKLITEKNNAYRDYQVKERVLDSMPPYQEGLEQKSAADVIEKYNRSLESVREIRDKRLRLDYLINESNDIAIRIRDLYSALKTMNEEIDKLKLENLEEPVLTDLSAEIESINAHNKQVQVNYQIKSTREECIKLHEIYEEKCAQLKTLEIERTNLIAYAKMPINGLSFSEDGLLFDGLPFTEEQLSTSKLIETGIRISMALNPALRIMRIKEASLLDAQTLEMIKQAAIDNDYQLFVEMVSNSDEIGFVIEE